jgi:predicted ester cyclase
MNKEKQIQFAIQQLVQGNFDVVDKIFSKEYLVHAGSKEYKGLEFIKRFIQQLLAAIPDLKIDNVEFLSQAEDKVAWQRTFSGTHKAKMRGIPPSGKKVKWVEMVVSRFKDEMIVEEWVVSELAGKLALRKPQLHSYSDTMIC